MPDDLYVHVDPLLDVRIVPEKPTVTNIPPPNTMLIKSSVVLEEIDVQE